MHNGAIFMRDKKIKTQGNNTFKAEENVVSASKPQWTFSVSNWNKLVPKMIKIDILNKWNYLLSEEFKHIYVMNSAGFLIWYPAGYPVHPYITTWVRSMACVLRNTCDTGWFFCIVLETMNFVYLKKNVVMSDWNGFLFWIYRHQIELPFSIFVMNLLVCIKNSRIYIMALISDGNSEHVVRVWRKIGLFKHKLQVFSYCWPRQITYNKSNYQYHSTRAHLYLSYRLWSHGLHEWILPSQECNMCTLLIVKVKLCIIIIYKHGSYFRWSYRCAHVESEITVGIWKSLRFDISRWHLREKMINYR